MGVITIVLIVIVVAVIVGTAAFLVLYNVRQRRSGGGGSGSSILPTSFRSVFGGSSERETGTRFAALEYAKPQVDIEKEDEY